MQIRLVWMIWMMIMVMVMVVVVAFELVPNIGPNDWSVAFVQHCLMPYYNDNVDADANADVDIN